MDAKLNYYLHDLEKNEIGAPEALVQNLLRQLDFELPKDYIGIMLEFDGGEGEVGENSWLCLFPIEDLIPTNKAYKLLMEQIPDYFLFGKDAADTGYAFHKFNKTIHSFGLMSNFKTDYIKFCGNSFIEFVEYLYTR
jgi:hypothetical protein